MILKIKLLALVSVFSFLFGYVININGNSFDEQDFYTKEPVKYIVELEML